MNPKSDEATINGELCAHWQTERIKKKICITFIPKYKDTISNCYTITMFIITISVQHNLL